MTDILKPLAEVDISFTSMGCFAVAITLRQGLTISGLDSTINKLTIDRNVSKSFNLWVASLYLCNKQQ